MDITEEILWQHGLQRRLFAHLDEIDEEDTAALAAVWSRLAILLEVHAAAEEAYVHPVLLRLGTGRDGEGPDDEVEDVIHDHNEIRNAVEAARGQETSSPGWWQAVWAARAANDEHMAEEERNDLWDLRKHLSLEERHGVAMSFIRFVAEHIAMGVPAEDKDPEQYVESDGVPS